MALRAKWQFMDRSVTHINNIWTSAKAVHVKANGVTAKAVHIQTIGVTAKAVFYYKI